MIEPKIKERDGYAYYKAVFKTPVPCLMEAPAAYDAAEAEMERRKATAAGRNQLRDDGWVLEGDPSDDYRE